MRLLDLDWRVGWRDHDVRRARYSVEAGIEIHLEIVRRQREEVTEATLRQLGLEQVDDVSLLAIPRRPLLRRHVHQRLDQLFVEDSVWTGAMLAGKVYDDSVD